MIPIPCAGANIMGHQPMPFLSLSDDFGANPSSPLVYGHAEINK
jgi:hypothetical protein